ncbi:MAG: GAF domain-containing protein, partial [Candidatus Rokubacteria bacterium]|nr:GAF domain-containing protein [Candidatus Rokubacteria bacterium]
MDRHARAVVVSSPLSAVKDQASLPTEAPGPLREAEEGRQALERLYRVALAMQTSWGREERLGAFIHGAHEVVDFDRVSVLLATPDGTGLELVRTHGEKGTIPPAILPLSRSAGPFYQAFQTRRPVAVLRDEDLGKIVPLDSGYQSHPSFRTTRFVIAPLIVGGRTIGVAGADNKPSRRPISPASIEPFTLLCQLLAVALEETRLHLETRAREQETTLLCTGLTLLNQASRALQRTLNVDGMLNNALGELARSFGAGTVFVDLLSESGDVERRVGDWLSEAHGRDLSRSGGRASEFVQLTRAPLVLRDITERPDIVHPAHFAHGVKSLVAFPVVGQEHRVLGVLFLCYQVPQRFPDSEIHLLSAYSDQLAMALENAQLYEESERRRREAEVLAELTGTLNASLDVRTVLGRVLEGAKELCRSDLARVALREAGSDALVVRHWLGPRRPWYETTRIEPGKGVGGRVLRTGRPFRTAHYAEDPRISKDYLELAREMGVVAGMAVPIRIDGRVDGVLFVDNCSPRPFTDRDEAFLLRVADHAAIAIKNARLYEEATRRRREAEEMGRVARMLTESLDVSALSERIVQSVLHLFGARSSGLRLLQPDGSLLAIAAGDPSRAHSWLGHVLPSG